MLPFSAFPLVTLLCFIQPTISFGKYERAISSSGPSINPSLSGQSGVSSVNPLIDLGPPSNWIGINYQYQTPILVGGQTSTKWIGVNTEYLTTEVETEMNPATPSATLSVIMTGVGVIASTATATGNGLKPGDVSVTFSPALIEELKDLALEVCGSGSKNRLMKRESCAYEYANRVAAPGGPMEFDISCPTLTASDIAEIISVIGRKEVAGPIGLALILWYIWAETGDMPNTLDIPKEDIGTPNYPSAPATNPSAPATTTGPACPTGSNSPLCQDSVGCNSPNNVTCTTSVQFETCSCLIYLNIEFHPATPSNLLAAQSNLASMSSIVDSVTTTMAAPNCSASGAPGFLPTSWCNCGVSATYPTIPPSSGVTASTANCAYTVLPTATIKPIFNANVANSTTKPISNTNMATSTAKSISNTNMATSTAKSMTNSTVVAPTTKPMSSTTVAARTTTPSPPVSSSTPPPAPTMGSIVCNPLSYAANCSWSDVQSNWVDSLADYMGEQFTTSVFTPTTSNFTRILRDGGASGKGVIYLMSVGWIQGCVSQTSEKMDRPLDPNKEFDWQTLLKDNYYNCTGNNGLGGYTDVGCLRYGFFPNKYPGVFPSTGTPQYANFWNAMHYCVPGYAIGGL